jgi:hypothetical protein
VADRLEQLEHEPRTRGVLVSALEGVDLKQHQAIPLEAGPFLVQPRHRLEEQASADQQDQGEGDLTNDQRPAEPDAATARRTLPEGRNQRKPSGLERWRSAAQRTGRDADQACEQQDAEIQMRREARARDVLRKERQQHGGHGRSQGDPEQPSRERDHHALDQQLVRDAAA